MDISTIFLQRYDPLYNNYLTGYWSHVSYEQMRQRPHARANSIAWNLWHIARCEDAGINRFVLDRAQVLDDGNWMERMNLPWRHHGSGMTMAEVDELDQRIDLSALRDYSQAVQKRTRAILTTLDMGDLESEMEEGRLRQIMIIDGLAHSQADGFIKNYLGWSRMKCLLTFGLTHSWQHLGEMEVLASLLDVEFA